MPNHNGSLYTLGSNGSITGPIEASWESWLNDNREAFNITEHNEAAVKYCFMCSAVNVYNLFMELIRQDPSMVLMTKVTAAIKTDFDRYFVPKTDQPN